MLSAVIMDPLTMNRTPFGKLYGYWLGQIFVGNLYYKYYARAQWAQGLKKYSKAELRVETHFKMTSSTRILLWI